MNAIDVEKISEIVSEISRQLAGFGCVLSSGETSEMRSLIPSGKLDIAGFAVGIVHKDKVLPKATLQKGDLIVYTFFKSISQLCIHCQYEERRNSLVFLI